MWKNEKIKLDETNKIIECLKKRNREMGTKWKKEIISEYILII